jgi:hypothetical protein
MSCTAEDVPQDLWTQILQHVPWYQRLSACALVNQKLARAAPAATQSLDLDFEDSPTNHDAFLDWTMSHGGYLTRLYLHSVSSHSPIRQLPCPNLLELHLDEASVQLCASREHLGLLHSCTALTQLCLIYPTLLDGDVEGPAGAAPAAAARLQRFVLDADQPFTIQFAEANEHGKLWEALHDRLIPQLTSLTELAVGGRLQSCCTEHISTLVGLQKLFSKQGEDADMLRPDSLP